MAVRDADGLPVGGWDEHADSHRYGLPGERRDHASSPVRYRAAWFRLKPMTTAYPRAGWRISRGCDSRVLAKIRTDLFDIPAPKP